MKIQAVLLDVGGVLVDDTEFHQLTQSHLLELLKNDGFQVSSEELVEILHGVWSQGLSPYRHATLWHFAKPDLERFQRLCNGLKPLREFYEVWKPRLFPMTKEIVASLGIE